MEKNPSGQIPIHFVDKVDLSELPFPFLRTKEEFVKNSISNSNLKQVICLLDFKASVSFVLLISSSLEFHNFFLL